MPAAESREEEEEDIFWSMPPAATQRWTEERYAGIRYVFSFQVMLTQHNTSPRQRLSWTAGHKHCRESGRKKKECWRACNYALATNSRARAGTLCLARKKVFSHGWTVLATPTNIAVSLEHNSFLYLSSCILRNFLNRKPNLKLNPDIKTGKKRHSKCVILTFFLRAKIAPMDGSKHLRQRCLPWYIQVFSKINELRT